MGLYAKYVLPRLIELAMRNPEITPIRAELISRSAGTVLELGIGSGLNLRFYPAGVQRIYGVDPSLELQERARPRASEAPAPVEFLLQSAAERLPLADSSIDTAGHQFGGFVPQLGDGRALREVRRVLRPAGRLLFAEHGRSPDARVRLWQERVNPVWKRIGGGCHVNRPIDELIRAAGFEVDALQTRYLPGPRILTYTYQGSAHPRA